MLRRKALRDLVRHPGQAAMLVVVFALGVVVFIGIRTSFSGLAPAATDLYDRLRLPDLVARVAFAPAAVIGELAALPGVAAVEGRVAFDASALGHPGVTVRIVGVADDPAAAVGRVEVARGRSYQPGANEVLIAETAVAPHELALGETLRLQSPRGGVTDLEIVGTARQPEHLAMIPEHGFMAMPRTYMVAFVSPATANRLLGRSGGVTELAIALAPGADGAATEAAVRETLRRYRPNVVAASELPSVRNVASHLDALRGAAIVFSALFLVAGSVGGFVLLSRVVQRERSSIGLLRAFGVGKARVALHYLSYTLTLAAVGVVLGAPFGRPLAGFVRGIFAADLGTPVIAGSWRWDVTAAAVAATLLAGAVAGLAPSLTAASLRPTDAMRPDAPAVPPRMLSPVRAGCQRVPTGFAMVVRNLRRRPARTALTAVGITFAVVLALAPALVLSETAAVESRVRAVRGYDLRVTPRAPRSEAWLEDLRSVAGVTRAEPLLEIPVDARFGETELRTYVVAVAPDSTLLRLPVPEPGRAFLALGLPSASASVSLRGPLGSVELPVGRRVDYPLGRPVLLSLADARRLLAPPAILGDAVRAVFGFELPGLDAPISAALISLSPDAAPDTADLLRARSDVGRVDDRDSEEADLERIFSLTRAFIGVIEVFAIVLGFAIVFNTVTVNALERRRELATLRVVGFDHDRVARLFRLEALTTALLAVPFALPVAWWLAGVALRDFGEFLPTGIALRAQPVTLTFAGLVVVTLAACTPALRDLRRTTLADEVRTRA